MPSTVAAHPSAYLISIGVSSRYVSVTELHSTKQQDDSVMFGYG